MTLAKKLMAEYDGTPAAMPRGMSEHYHGKQPGDPAKAAAAIIATIESPKPPLHLLLGPDAVCSRPRQARPARRGNLGVGSGELRHQLLDSEVRT